jgi:hypothetical protein
VGAPLLALRCSAAHATPTVAFTTCVWLFSLRKNDRRSGWRIVNIRCDAAGGFLPREFLDRLIEVGVAEPIMDHKTTQLHQMVRTAEFFTAELFC